MVDPIRLSMSQLEEGHHEKVNFNFSVTMRDIEIVEKGPLWEKFSSAKKTSLVEPNPQKAHIPGAKSTPFSTSTSRTSGHQLQGDLLRRQRFRSNTSQQKFSPQTLKATSSTSTNDLLCNRCNFTSKLSGLRPSLKRLENATYFSKEGFKKRSRITAESSSTPTSPTHHFNGLLERLKASIDRTVDVRGHGGHWFLVVTEKLADPHFFRLTLTCTVTWLKSLTLRGGHLGRNYTSWLNMRLLQRVALLIRCVPHWSIAALGQFGIQ